MSTSTGTEAGCLAGGESEIVLQVGCGVASNAVIETAVLLARALAAGLDARFIEDPRLVDAATYSFTREVTYFGGRIRDITTERVVAEMRSCSMAVRHRLADIARHYGVDLRYRTLRRTEAEVAAAIGPGTRYLALSQPQTASGSHRLADIIAASPQLRGYLVAGGNARHRRGPVLAPVRGPDDVALLHPLLARLADAAGLDLLLLPTDPDPRRIAGIVEQLEREPLPRLRLLPPVPAHMAALETFVQRGNVQLAVVPLSHPLAEAREDLARLVTGLSAPLLLLRNGASHLP